MAYTVMAYIVMADAESTDESTAGNRTITDTVKSSSYLFDRLALESQPGSENRNGFSHPHCFLNCSM